MFTETEPGIAVSSEGFKVIGRGRKVVYIEANHVAEFVADPGGKKWVILLKHVGWNPPHAGEPISDEKRAEVQRRVVGALQFLKSYCVFDFEH